MSAPELPPTVGVLGYGVDGRAVAAWLATRPEVQRILVFDDREVSVSGASGKVRRGTDLVGVALLFRSPGVRPTHPLLAQARGRGMDITSSTQWFLAHTSSRTVGITGSNGKTTCSTLIFEMLKAEYGESRVAEGGNDRKPRLDLLTTHYSLLTTHFVVLELSSFQLVDCAVSPSVAVVLNVTPNHLDWHESMSEYAEAKRNIVRFQVSGVRCQDVPDTAVLNQNDPTVRRFAKGLKSEVRWFDEPSTVNCQLSTVRFKTHPDTICAAVTAARALGVSERNIIRVLASFPGVPHRMEFIREIDGVRWYNDSSCTTPESAIVACETFPEGTMILLLGGRDKGMDFSKLYEVIRERKVRIIPYGEMAETFMQNLPTTHYPLPTTHCPFKMVIDAARSHAEPGDNIVLSPACTSFDMFANAKERGHTFETIVRELP